MPDYTPPIRDIRFLLDHVISLEQLLKLEPFQGLDEGAVHDVVDGFGQLMAEVWAPTNEVGDREGSHVEGDTVRLATGFAEAYDAYREAGWGAVPFEEVYGGGGFPWTVGTVMQELINSANMALAMLPTLTQGAIDAILHHGSEDVGHAEASSGFGAQARLFDAAHAIELHVEIKPVLCLVSHQLPALRPTFGLYREEFQAHQHHLRLH